MSKTKAGGSTKNGRDSRSKRLGVKLFGGQEVTTGDIIIRQRGNKYEAGENTFLGKDYTIHAGIDGQVSFRQTRKTLFSGAKRRKTVVFVTPIEA
ncbi:50S ribosomal protein L27 [bacterium]|nr:MAG: 50S ribosomal protein L27 [bacterium]